ncbi:hypothetical protein NZK32_00315 [Cyanobium sp. FGCU-52]|nr:hypothetical protein [Cyanobium sp. FGCU52]
MAAQGPLPAGMLRIRQGLQERFVWPVHLPGWLALGWQVAGAGTSPPDGLQPQAVMAPALTPDAKPEPTATEKELESATARGKRGRRRKEEQDQPPAVVKTPPEETETMAVAGELDAEPGGDSIAEGDDALSALPDDLFSDPLI